ncbi:MAG: ribosome biogenesis GTPase Der [Candidatus Hydrogenedentota bacterium]|uniref:GTPase Der n=1 Tax=Sumerlaea chitinivorans TaxID=2250252 RepID=A0A2Z4Y740_SUMC1|nr:GTP-binding protein EngA [Candidatus Sumerlaea chitinivorans]MCX7963813.1 ribosome biogenesis GTPase Der [Candidatus Sumerlaea chitinivorans]RMH28620.1 MAG: ribosome biogenesis GTPase Der [Candidatus Hydrogenedentota bacterium]
MKREILYRHLPIVAVVGRPNVGKSTLFNRITGRRKAVVLDTPGVTRDRNYHIAEWNGTRFLTVDTGGYEHEPTSELSALMREQTLLAIEEADAIILLLDSREPMHPTDDEVIELLRRTAKPVFVAVNKCDNREQRLAAISEFARLGLELYPISALHGHGTGDLLDAVVASLPKRTEEEEAAEAELGIRIAVVGRPNVGKSTLVNRILGFERTIASPVPGTTRDAIDTTFRLNDKIYTLIDTAGIRRRGKIERGAENLSVLSALMSLERCDIALILVDATEGITDQDAHVAGYAVDAGCGCIIVVNKWDLVEKDETTAGAFVKALRAEWGFLKHAPVIHVSALTGQRVERLFQLVDRVYAEYTKEIETSTLNRWLQKAISHVSPPVRQGRQLKLKYVVQTGSKPPTFTFFVNDPALVHYSYERYLANQLRQEFGFEGVPVRLRFREKAERARSKKPPWAED